MDGICIDSDKIADALYYSLLVLAIKIFCKWSLLYLFLSGLRFQSLSIHHDTKADRAVISDIVRIVRYKN
mgnify:CR=1 FL=1